MASLQEELARARAERDRLNVVVEYLEQRVNANGHRPRPAPRKTGTLTIAAAAEQALAAHDAPMGTRELLDQVRQLGAQARDGEALAKALTRAGRFDRPSRGMWTLAR